MPAAASMTAQKTVLACAPGEPLGEPVQVGQGLRRAVVAERRRPAGAAQLAHDHRRAESPAHAVADHHPHPAVIEGRHVVPVPANLQRAHGRLVAHPEPGRQVVLAEEGLLQRQREITGLLVMDGAGQRVAEVCGQQAEQHASWKRPAAAPAIHQPYRRLTAARVQPRGDARRVAITACLGHHEWRRLRPRRLQPLPGGLVQRGPAADRGHARARETAACGGQTAATARFPPKAWRSSASPAWSTSPISVAPSKPVASLVTAAGRPLRARQSRRGQSR